MAPTIRLRVRFLADPSVCLWLWEIVDGADGTVESSWNSRWTVYGSAREAARAGLARLAELASTSGLAREPGSPSVHDRQLVIVRRGETGLYRSLSRAFGDNDRIEVVLDRRGRARGAGNGGSERRARRDVDAFIHAHGWALVTLSGAG